ncbi:Serine/threonine-protein kinase TOR [Quillaja saponaria]|uniref:Serine/threonine-protein kinase TOR n=1 Tax=Quillaja saponaria TaxID=32244 RepID=A0AAD7PG06_QUISA|nr:Serine/threonine-protein kinase TOR [Quillaja saponaria]
MTTRKTGESRIRKPARVRSPAASKSTKHFMSPTVSASSKVTVSPRKKILHERNEPVRPSVSSCDSKSPFRKVTFAELPEEIDSKGEIGLEEELLESLTVPMNSQVPDFKVPLSSKTEPELLVKIVTEEQNCVNLDPTFNISPTPPRISSHSTLLAPLDADPLMPPYDPKTTSPYDPERNYMSPRPQFLCYRPHPRVKYYKERGGIRTEERLYVWKLFRH